MIAVKVDSYRW